jgi:uncharacterized membrane protein YheB (UPF0754 family)
MLLPPLLGAGIGYFTNWLAIKMLFRPYTKKTVTIEGLKINVDLPFTPGLFPKEQERLAGKVAHTVTHQLLTPEDIRIMTVKLITPENIETGVNAIVDSILKEFQNIRKLRDISREIAGLLSAFLIQSAPEIIIASAKKSTLLKDFLEKTFDSVILKAKIPRNTASTFTNSFFYHVATPNNIRNWVLEVLSQENIEEVNKLVQENTRGSYYYLFRIITVKAILENIREFLKNDPETANETIQATMKELEIRQKIAEGLSEFTFESLPYSTVSMLKEHFVSILLDYIAENSKQVADKITPEELTQLITERILKYDPSNFDPETLSNIKKEIAGFISKYLEREIGNLLEKAIPKMGIDNVIFQKVAQFSPKRLEEIITDISRKELKGIERIGGVIGFIIGCINSLSFMLMNS